MNREVMNTEEGWDVWLKIEVGPADVFMSRERV